MSKNKHIKQDNGSNFNQKDCDGFTKRYISKSGTISDDELVNDEINQLMILANSADNYHDALKCYDDILEKYDYYKALNEKGFILIDLKEFNNAIDCFDKSLELTKNNYDAHIGNAIAYSELLKLEDSINMGLELEMRANLKIACILNNEGYYIKYKLFKEIGDYEGALKSLNNYLKYNPLSFYKDKDYFLSILFLKAELNYLLGNIYDAFHMFYQYLRFNEDDINALMYMAIIAPHFDKYDYSFKCFDKIFEMNDTIFDAILLKAELLVNLNRYEEAIDCFKICPISKLSNKHKQLLNHAKNQIGNDTKYYAVSKVRNGSYNYVYTFYKNGLRKIYATDLYELKSKVYSKGLLFKEIIYREAFTLGDYIMAYHKFPDFPTEYKDIISSILNKDFAKKFNENKINIDDILESKTFCEQEFIKQLMDCFFKRSRQSNRTGYFCVTKWFGRSSYSPNWRYRDKLTPYEDLDFYSDSLEELESMIKNAGLFWFIYNEDLAEKSRIRDFELNKK